MATFTARSNTRLFSCWCPICSTCTACRCALMIVSTIGGLGGTCAAGSGSRPGPLCLWRTGGWALMSGKSPFPPVHIPHISGTACLGTSSLTKTEGISPDTRLSLAGPFMSFILWRRPSPATDRLVPYWGRSWWFFIVFKSLLRARSSADNSLRIYTAPNYPNTCNRGIPRVVEQFIRNFIVCRRI